MGSLAGGSLTTHPTLGTHPVSIQDTPGKTLPSVKRKEPLKVAFGTMPFESLDDTKCGGLPRTVIADDCPVVVRETGHSLSLGDL